MSADDQRLTHGYRSTEFWSTLLTHLFTIATTVYVVIDQPFPDRLAGLQLVVPAAAFVASSIAQVAYNISRGRVKAALMDAVAAMDDAAAVWKALFPNVPVPGEVLEAADAKRQAAAGFAGVQLTAKRSS